MKIQKIPIKCSPQIMTIPVSATIIDVTPTTKLGDIHLPQLVISTPYSSIGEVLHVITVHCVCVEDICSSTNQVRDCDNVMDAGGVKQLRSLIQFANTPVNVQEAKMKCVGVFTHKYNKKEYHVFYEDLTINNSGHITPTGTTGSSRALAEGSLSRTIT